MKLIQWSPELAGEKTIIYGKTVGGGVILNLLKKNNANIFGFCDKNTTDDFFCSYPVIHPQKLLDHLDAIILIAVTRSFESVCQTLEEMNVEEAYIIDDMIKEINIDTDDVQVLDFIRQYPMYVSQYKKARLVLPTLEVFITEKCTLRCRDCSHLIPRYSCPRNYDIDSIISNLNKILGFVEKVDNLVILGGEPFLHPEIITLIDWVGKEKQISQITVLSNGTVMISDDVINCLKQNNAIIRISNYGELSRRKEEIKSKCDEAGVRCFLLNELWTDMGPILEHKDKKEDLIKKYKNCPFAFDFLLIKDNVFRCAHVAHLNNLGCIETTKHDAFMLSTLSDNQDENKKKFLNYLKIDYLLGCSYCNGYQNGKQGIEPAIQGYR